MNVFRRDAGCSVGLAMARIRRLRGGKFKNHYAQQRKYCGGLAAALGERGTLASSYSMSGQIILGIIRRRAAACGRTSPAGPLFGSHELQLWCQLCVGIISCCGAARGRISHPNYSSEAKRKSVNNATYHIQRANDGLDRPMVYVTHTPSALLAEFHSSCANI